MEEPRDSLKITEAKSNGVVQYSNGIMRIYKITVENFLRHFTSAYLILDGAVSLVDVGYNGVNSSAFLERGSILLQ